MFKLAKIAADSFTHSAVKHTSCASQLPSLLFRIKSAYRLRLASGCASYCGSPGSPLGSSGNTPMSMSAPVLAGLVLESFLGRCK